MFIPVSLGSGLTTVNCIADATGTLTAGCEVIYKTATYFPNAPVQVTKGDTIQLRTTIAGPAEIAVSLGERTYYWHVDLPKTLRYVEDLAFQRITGTVYGKLYSFPSNTQRAYTETGTLTKNEDILASIDYLKKEIWLFGSGGGVKKITTPEKPVAVVFMPRWSIADEVVTTPYLVTESKVYQFNDDMSLNVESGQFANGAGPIVAAAVDSTGILVLSDRDVSRYIPNQGVSNIYNVGGSSIQVTYDNKIILGRNDGQIALLAGSGTSYSQEALFTERVLPNGSTIGVQTRYLLDVNHAEYVFAIDLMNRKVISIKLSDKTVTQRNLDRVPSSIVSHEDSVYVSFFNHIKTFKYNTDLSVMEEQDGVKTHGSSYLNAFIATDLYSDAVDVTTPEDATPIVLNKYDVGVDVAELVYEWQVSWNRPQFVKVASTDATVTKNDEPFSEGYVVFPDKLKVTLPSSGEYYTDSQFDLIGYRPVSIHFRTEPKLFPDSVTIDTVYEAFIRRQYEDIFQIEGMTDGFSVKVGTDSGDMEFSINDAPYAKTGTIKNGDVVEVRATIQNMITTRNQHDIMTEFGMPVSLWTILVMQLNGVVLRPDVTLEKDKFESVRSIESAVEEVSTDPQLSVSSQRMLSSEGYTAQITNVTVNDQPSSGVLWSSNCLQERQLSSAVTSGATKTSTGFTDNQLNTSLRTYQLDSESVLFQPTSHDSILQITTLDAVFGTHPTQFSFSSDGVVIAAHTIEQSSSYFVVDSTKTWSQPVDIVAVRQDIAFAVDQNYLRYVGVTSIDQPTEIARYLGFASVEQAPDTIIHSLLHSSEFTASVDRFYSSALPDTTMTHAMSGSTRNEEGALFHVLKLHSDPVLLSMDAVLRLPVSSSDWESGVSLATRSTSEFQSDAIQTPSTTELFGSNVVMLRRNDSLELEMPTSKWVLSNQDEYFIEGAVSGFFDTLEDAQAYAATINLKENTPAQFRQYDGKWILTSAPVADNAACFPTEVPAGLQRRFGYAGGG